MVGPLIKGLRITFGHLFKPAVTVKYPYEKREVAQRWRGRHLLRLDQEGRELCCYCGLCEAVCPANAIRIYGMEDPTFTKSDVGKIAEIYEIDYRRCIFCGYCAEACPRGAIILTTDYELAEPERKRLLQTKEVLLEKR